MRRRLEEEVRGVKAAKENAKVSGTDKNIAAGRKGMAEKNVVDNPTDDTVEASASAVDDDTVEAPASAVVGDTATAEVSASIARTLCRRMMRISKILFQIQKRE